MLYRLHFSQNKARGFLSNQALEELYRLPS
jgi:hypothetical protein